MTDRERATITDEAVRTAIVEDPTDQTVETVWRSVTSRLDATAQRQRGIDVWPWTPLLPGMHGSRAGLHGLPLVALFVVILAGSIGAIGLVATSRHLPPPYGLATSGLIAFDEGGDIYVADPDGSGRRALITGPADEIQPTWSPDGTMIAYLSLAPSEPYALVIVADADGTNQRTVASKAVSFDTSGASDLLPYGIAGRQTAVRWRSRRSRQASPGSSLREPMAATAGSSRARS